MASDRLRRLRELDGDDLAGQPLSLREREVLQAVVRCGRNAEIARTLRIRQQTVKNHLWSIYRKLGVQCRSEAIAEAVRGQLIPPDG